MVYELEKNRLGDLLTATVRIARTRDTALDREAQERAVEASLQTGMNIGSADGEDLIIHPLAAERRSRLGVPTTVGTAELATWNYLFYDPIQRAAQGLLNSPDHRAVLDNSYYDNWGFGIHTKMPDGQTDELLRRWWIIIWLSNVPILGASMATPSETYSTPKYVGFPAGRYYGYKFGYDGRVISSKVLNIATGSRANAKGRARIPNRSGHWLLMADGFFADHWVQENGFRANPNIAKLE